MAGEPKSQSVEPYKKAVINVIPLIDVIFFLLATFVLFTLSLNKIQSVPINLPRAEAAPKTDQEDTSVTLQVSDGGNLYWNKELITMSEVRPRLQDYKDREANPRVLIATDDQAKYGDTILVLDEVRQVGIEQVSFETVFRPTGR
jgi:biopolymer transport protein ExbD